ncbi:hypothetical protein [Paraburkholderia sp. PGU19]|uniref:hypothetical protein n=1 Tax=Paraburkholderia sp. PGU19 TaxID=2735434 RepID=UPI0015DB5FBE|nr:hypothetical protein [Paraburkholderia sp. PGU19]
MAIDERIIHEKPQLTLRGPTRTVTLETSSEGLLNRLNIGVSVRVHFVEATAIQISRAGVSLQEPIEAANAQGDSRDESDPVEPGVSGGIEGQNR